MLAKRQTTVLIQLQFQIVLLPHRFSFGRKRSYFFFAWFAKRIYVF